MRYHLVVLAVLLAVLGSTSPALAQSFRCGSSGGTSCYANIPDAGGFQPTPPLAPETPGVLTSTFTIPAGTCASLPFGSVQVYTDLHHDWLGDLQLRVISPNGAATTLFSRPALTAGPGGALAADIRATFVGAGGGGGFDRWEIPAVTGLVGSLDSLSVLGGQEATGEWTLELTDFSNSGVGGLNDWGINVVCGAVSITASSPTAREVPVLTGAFTVTRAIVGPRPITVNVVIGGTATAGDDYPSIVVPVVIPAGQASVDLVVTPTSDHIVEGTETVLATVQSGDGYTVGTQSSATVVIYDLVQAAEIPAVDPAGLAVLLALIGLVGAWVLRSRQG
jgi:subtilisin-like proprotein convertase family protein